MIRRIDHIAEQYPELDLISVRILLQIADLPGYSIREIADILGLDYKNACLKIAMMAEGRGKKLPHSRRYRLITVSHNPADRRKRNLYLTPSGEELAERLYPLAEESGQ